MISAKRASRIFAENRFLNVAFAAEAFHRDVYGGQFMPAGEFDDVLSVCLNAVPERHRDWLRPRLAYANSPPFESGSWT